MSQAQRTMLRGRRLWVPLVTLWIVWGTTYAATAAMVRTMPPLVSTGSRYVVGGAILMGGLAAIRGRAHLRLRSGQLHGVIVMGVGIIGVWAAATALAVRFIPSGIAALIAASIPVWVVLFRVAGGDRPSRTTALGVFIGLAGIALLFAPGGISPIRDDAGPGTVALWSFVMLAGSLTWAFVSWRSRAFTLPRDPLVTAAYQLMIGGAAVLILGVLVGEHVDLPSYTGTSWVGWGWLVVASTIGYAAYSLLLAGAPVSLVSTFPYVNPVVAVLTGAALLAEPVTAVLLCGMAVIVIGVALVVRGERPAPE